jgi:hypothetical protein
MKAFRNISLSFALVAALVMGSTAKADTTYIYQGQTLTEGQFTFNFISVAINGTTIVSAASDPLYLNAADTTVSDNGRYVNLAFTNSGYIGEAAVNDIALRYTVTGPTGKYTLDNWFLSGSLNHISEVAGASIGDNGRVVGQIQVGGDNGNTQYGTTAYSDPLTSTGLFWVEEDFQDHTDTSEFTNSVHLAPEPSSLLMFGTGLLGMAGLLRSKFARSSR